MNPESRDIAVVAQKAADEAGTRGGRRAFSLSLAQRLAVLALIALAPASLVLVYNEIDFRRTKLDDLRVETARNARLADSEIDQILGGIRAVLTAVAAVPFVRDFDTGSCSPYVAEINRQLLQLTAINVVDLQGRSRCHSLGPQAAGENFSDRSYFRQAVESRSFTLGTYLKGRVSGRTLLPLSTPLFDREGKVSGALSTGLSLDWLGERLRDRGVIRGGAVTIADREGTIIAREPYPERFVGTRIPEAFLTLVRGTVAGTEEVTSQDGTRRVIGYIPAAVSISGLYVSAGTDSELAFELIDRSTNRSLALLGFGALATLVLAWWFGRTYIRRPINRLVRTAEAWRRGDLSVRTEMDERGGDIEAAGRAFDLLADALVVQQRERDRADQQRDLVIGELTHRVRNVLATVQSVAGLSFRNAQGPEALKAFNSRLQALAKGHDFLTQKNWDQADIADIVRGTIAPHGGETEPRFVVTGPSALLPPTATVSVTMMLHELCTNAVKYGALSSEQGRVAISWTAQERDDGVAIDLRWQESGGPPATPPTRTGFGSRLLAALAQEMGGGVETAYAPEGLLCLLRLRLPKPAPAA
jgi:two-component sensor histidine kinase